MIVLRRYSNLSDCIESLFSWFPELIEDSFEERLYAKHKVPRQRLGQLLNRNISDTAWQEMVDTKKIQNIDGTWYANVDGKIVGINEGKAARDNVVNRFQSNTQKAKASAQTSVNAAEAMGRYEKAANGEAVRTNHQAAIDSYGKSVNTHRGDVREGTQGVKQVVADERKAAQPYVSKDKMKERGGTGRPNRGGQRRNRVDLHAVQQNVATEGEKGMPFKQYKKQVYKDAARNGGDVVRTVGQQVENSNPITQGVTKRQANNQRVVSSYVNNPKTQAEIEALGRQHAAEVRKGATEDYLRRHQNGRFAELVNPDNARREAERQAKKEAIRRRAQERLAQREVQSRGQRMTEAGASRAATSRIISGGGGGRGKLVAAGLTGAAGLGYLGYRHYKNRKVG